MAIPEINFFIIEYDGHVLRYSFAGREDGQSILMTVNLFLHFNFLYHTDK